MRKITEQSIAAFNNNRDFKKSNMRVFTKDINGMLFTCMSLWDNIIAFKDQETGIVSITNCGYETNTTKDRLNAIDGVHIHQKDFVWYLNGKMWDGKLTEIK
tara:strand:- start:1528 stop:1833 length:306 start_codon:yes stop_codon:yes gene_type:complete